jgi:hypothetical protein
VATHEFVVRRGQVNPTPTQWREVRAELTSWYPGCRLESDVIAGEMGPFGVRIAQQVSIILIGGPDSRATAAGLLRRALDKIGRIDLLEAEQAG